MHKIQEAQNTSGIPDPQAYGAKTRTSIAARTTNINAQIRYIK